MPILLLLAFLAIPVIEIAVIIRVGDWIGLWPTVGLIVFTAVAGTTLVRAQGFAVLQRARESLERGVFPAREMFDGAALLVAGLLLLTPGFITDAVGIVLLVPALRRAIGRALWHWFRGAAEVRVRRRHYRDDGEVIETEFHEVREERIGPRPTRPHPTHSGDEGKQGH